MLLKIILRESHIDTNVTVSHIRTQLSFLDTYLRRIGHDIRRMNDYVTSLRDALMARGETSNDLFVNLFKGCKAASDCCFIAYMEKKKEDYKDGSLSITPQQLMTLVKNRHEVLVKKASGPHHLRKRKRSWPLKPRRTPTAPTRRQVAQATTAGVNPRSQKTRRGTLALYGWTRSPNQRRAEPRL